MSTDKEKIIRYDQKTKSYVNGKGEALKFTPNSMSIYSKTPDKPHDATHINIDHKKGTFTVTTHKEGQKSTSQTGKCYLTTACIQHYMEDFNDNCYYLEMLRWFRDKFVSLEDKKRYYEIAPIIVDALDKLDNAKEIYEYIYNNVVKICVRLIEEEKFEETYQLYKKSILELEKTYVKKLV